MSEAGVRDLFTRGGREFMGMRTLAVIARKGGSGKTTTSLQLALAAHRRGMAVMLADADPQHSASQVLKGRTGAGPGCVETAGPKLFALQVAAMRSGVDALVIDTPAGPESDVGHAIVVADFCILVVRPTFLDIAAAVSTTEIIRRLGRKALVVLTQAPFSRGGGECETVLKAREALRFTSLPVAETVIRARRGYQIALDAGRSVEDMPQHAAAGAEIAALWSEIERAAYGRLHLRSA